MEQLAAFLLIIAISIVIIGLVKPRLAVNAAITVLKVNLKMMGLEGDIRATEKSERICRIWNLLILVLFLIILFAIRTT